MKIYHDDYEIYKSGVISSSGLSETRFVMSDEPHMEIVVRVAMDDGESGIKLEPISDDILACVFTNPTSMAFGPTEPMKVGKLNGKILFISFRVTMRGNNDSYGLEYTFYTKEHG